MRIVTKGTGLKEWSSVKGDARIGINPLFIKFDWKENGKSCQLIIEFDKHEEKNIKKLLAGDLLEEIEKEKREAKKRLKKVMEERDDWGVGYEHGFIRALNVLEERFKRYFGVQ